MKMPDLDELDTRIAAAEQRLVDRQDRVRHRWTALGAQAREATRPARLALPAAGLALLWLLLSRRRRHAAPAGGADTPARRRRRRHFRLPWLRLIGLGWALLPTHLRALAPRPVVQGITLFGPLLAGLLVRRRAVQREP